MPPTGFEPTIPPGERPQTHALDRAATGTGTEALRYVANVLAHSDEYSGGLRFVLQLGSLV